MQVGTNSPLRPAHDGTEDLRQALANWDVRPGVAWCPEPLRDRLTALIVHRARALSGLARRAVRLARALEMCHLNGYCGALYDGVPSVRAAYFKTLFQDSQAKTAAWLEVSNTGIRLRESEMNSPLGPGFEIGFAAMPLVAAYLNFAHNALGYEHISTLLAPCLDPDRPARAEPVAAALAQAVQDWLRPRLRPEHRVRQGRIMREFLEAHWLDRQAVCAEWISDDVILKFWQQRGVANPVTDGFKRYQNAVTRLMAFRLAISAALANSRIEGALGIGSEAGPDVVSEAQIEQALEEDKLWQSPLAALFQPGAADINWLTKRQRGRLCPLLPETGTDLLDLDASTTTVFAGARPDPAFYRTVLRYSTFGQWQNQLVQQARSKRHQTATAGGGPVGYADEQAAISAVRNAISDVTLATAASLLRRGNIHGLILCLGIDRDGTRLMLANLGISVVDLARHMADRDQPDGDREDEDRQLGFGLLPATTVKALADWIDQKHDPLAIRLARASAGINRAGFRRQDERDDAIGRALATGADALLPLATEVGAYVEWIESAGLARIEAEDRAAFLPGLKRLYPDLVEC